MCYIDDTCLLFSSIYSANIDSKQVQRHPFSNLNISLKKSIHLYINIKINNNYIYLDIEIEVQIEIDISRKLNR